MANLIGIAGNSGSGKTTGVRTLDPEKTVVISVTNKRLPFKGSVKNYKQLMKTKEGQWVGNYYSSKNVKEINTVFAIVNKIRTEVTTIVIDDSNYIMSCETMDRVSETGYGKFTLIAKNYYDLLTTAINLRDDLNIIVISHIENIGDVVSPQIKLKTTGK